jgi:hypothetical protein
MTTLLQTRPIWGNGILVSASDLPQKDPRFDRVSSPRGTNILHCLLSDSGACSRILRDPGAIKDDELVIFGLNLFRHVDGDDEIDISRLQNSRSRITESVRAND